MNYNEMKQWIDNADVESLLSKWRFAKAGSPWFVGEIGEYYSSKLKELREKNPNEYTRASKNIGWD